MKNDTICPYCNADVRINHEDGYEENVLHESECRECLKIFLYTVVITVDYDASKADCLNGAPHKFIKMPHSRVMMRCIVCDFESRIE